jgi:hypothetical protein
MAAGTITFTLSATNGCGTSTDQVNVHATLCKIGAFDLDDVSAAPADNSNGSLNCYPNPSNGKFYITIPSDSQNARVTIKDMNGKKILETPLDATQTEIELRDTPVGVYILIVESDGETVRDKIIIQ